MLPCYNEELNIESLILKWEEQRELLSENGYTLNIIVINDCSTDNTAKIAIKYANEIDGVLLINHKSNKGLSGGINTALSFFIENGDEGDLMCFMDGDDTHDPKYIHRMIHEIENSFDCVIASRYCSDSETVGIPKYRELLSNLAKYYYKILLNIPGVKDYTCGYRVYNYNIIKKLVDKFGSEPVKEKSFACMMEFLYKLYVVEAKFNEVGFTLRYDNKEGDSKMNVSNTALNSIKSAVNLKRIR